MKLKIKHILFLFIVIIANTLAAQTITIGSGTTEKSNNPMKSYNAYSWSANVYAKSEIGTTGTITSVAFNVSEAYDFTFARQRIYLAYISDSVFSWAAGTHNTYISPASVNATLVFDDSLRFDSLGWKTIQFQTPFDYNGSGHLLLLYEHKHGHAKYKNKPKFKSFTMVGVHAKNGATNTLSDFENDGGSSSYRPNTRFQFTPFSSNDLALTAWLTPNSITSLSSLTPVAVTIQNYSAIDHSDFNLRYSIDNGATWSTAMYTDTIPAGQSASFTFPSTVDFSSTGYYKMIAVIDNPGDTANHNDTIRQDLMNCGLPLSGTYTIGGNNPDFVRIEDAINLLESCGIAGPCVFNIAPGTHYGQINIGQIAGTSATNSITFQTANLGDVSYRYLAIHTGDKHVLRLDSTAHIILKNLVLIGEGTLGAITLDINNSKHILVDNCVLKCKRPTQTFSSYNTIKVSSSDSTMSHNISITNNIIEGAGNSVYIVGTQNVADVKKVLINNNEITGFRYAGISTKYCDSLLISNNNIIGDRPMNHGIYCSNHSNFLEVKNNRIYAPFGGYGIYLNYANGTLAEKLWVYNNHIVVVNDSYTRYGMHFHTCYHANVYYNTINLHGSVSDCIGLSLANGYNNTIKNNSVINKSGGYAIKVFLASEIASCSHNNFYTTGANLAHWAGATYSNLSALQAATYQNQNSISDDVSFHSRYNYNNNSSVLSENALPLTTVTTDIEGNSRSTQTPDIGAVNIDRYNNDVFVEEIVGMSTLCSGIPFAMDIKVKNVGLNTVQSLTLQWSVNNVLQTPGQWTGQLTNNTTINVGLGSYTFDYDSTYHIKIWVSAINSGIDSNNLNDTIIINNYLPPIGNHQFQVGSSANADFPSLDSAINFINQFSLCGHMTFNLESGTYYGQSIISNIVGSPTKTITFQSLSGNLNDVIIEYNQQNHLDSIYVLKIDHSSYINFKNLSFQSNLGTYNRILFIDNESHHISIDSCHFIGANYNVDYWSYHSQVYVYDSRTISIQHSSFVHGGVAIYANYSKNITVNQNQIDSSAYGVYVYDTDTVYITNNRIFIPPNNSQWITYRYGIQSRYCDHEVFIQRNHIEIQGGCSVSGIDFSSDNPYSTLGKREISNNMILGSQASDTATTLYGIGVTYSKYVDVYHNSVRLLNQSGDVYAFSANVTKFNNVKNNSFHVAHGYPVYFYNNNNLNQDYNNLKGNGNIGKVLNTSYTTMSSWRSATSGDAHSISIAPVYTSSSDLHIADNALLGKGTPLSAVNIDIDSNIRSTTAPDIGADEADVAQLDAAVIAITQPAVTLYTSPVTINTDLQNTGRDDITSLQLYLAVDQGTPSAFSWAGNLTSFDTIHNFSLGTHNLSFGAHTIKVWISQVNGQASNITSNDTLTKMVVMEPNPIPQLSPSAFDVHIITCGDTAIRNLSLGNIGTGELNYQLELPNFSIDTTSSQHFSNNGVTIHQFNNLPSNLDSITLYLTINGNFDGTNEYANVYVGNTLIGTNNGGLIYTNITDTFVLSAALLQGHLSQGGLEVKVENSSAVGTVNGTKLHEVKLSYEKPNWLKVQTTNGVVDINNAIDIPLIFKAQKLLAGQYISEITVHTNDSTNPTILVPCTLTVDNILVYNGLGSDTSVCHNDTVMLDAGLFDSYHWSDGSTTQYNAIDTAGVGMNTKMVWLEVVDSMTCIGYDTVYITFNDCINIEDISKNIKLKVFPNPTTDKIIIQSHNYPTGKTTVQIINNVGQVLREEEIWINQPQLHHQIDLGNFPTGSYTIRLIGKQISKQFIVILR